MMFALISGSFGGGQEFIGPFFSENDAEQYAEKNCDETNWEVVPLINPGNAVKDYIDHNDDLILQFKNATDDAIEQYGGSLPAKVVDLLQKLQTIIFQNLQKNFNVRRFTKIRIMERMDVHLEKDFDPVPGVTYYEIDACDDSKSDPGHSDECWTIYDGKLIDKETAIRIIPEFCKEIGRPDLADKFEFV